MTTILDIMIMGGRNPGALHRAFDGHTGCYMSYKTATMYLLSVMMTTLDLIMGLILRPYTGHKKVS